MHNVCGRIGTGLQQSFASRLSLLTENLRQVRNALLQCVAPHPSSATWPLIVAQELYVLDGCVFPLPKFGLRLTHAATTCGSICGKALVACFR
jgi:hypothetical protein